MQSNKESEMSGNTNANEISQKNWIKKWKDRAEQTGSVSSPDTKVMIKEDR